MTRRVRVIAEAGTNHNGSLELALQLVDAAAAAGADVVKFQVFHAKSLVVRNAPMAEYQQRNTGRSDSQLDLLRQLELPHAAFREVADHCQLKGIDFLATPFDDASLQFLTADLGVEEIKIASGEVTNGPLLFSVASTGKPVVLSTGMSTLGEVETALSVLAFGYLARGDHPSSEGFRAALRSAEGQSQLRAKVTLLHCTTEYPAPFSEVNLRAMDTLAAAFGLSVGLSDHTLGLAVAIAAVARGAVAIEKHFTIDRFLPGPDHKASLEPGELAALIASVRQVEEALGSGLKLPSEAELKNMPIARRSLVARTAINVGEIFCEMNVCAKRPGTGLSPMIYWDLLGRPATRRYEIDEMICEWAKED